MPYEVMTFSPPRRLSRDEKQDLRDWLSEDQAWDASECTSIPVEIGSLDQLEQAVGMKIAASKLNRIEGELRRRSLWIGEAFAVRTIPGSKSIFF
jgi:hypothetical protein